MKIAFLVASGIFLAALATTAVTVPAQALTMKECSAKYKEAKAAGTLNGMKWNDFRKSQCGAEATAAPAPATPPAAETKPAATEAKPASGGRQAMYARERACGKEWKADKAAGKIQAGMKWPQYWSACDKRKKAEGM
jgi:hypothetical protein